MKPITFTRQDIIELISICDKSTAAIKKEAEADNLHDRSAYDGELNNIDRLKSMFQDALDENCIFTSRQTIV